MDISKNQYRSTGGRLQIVFVSRIMRTRICNVIDWDGFKYINFSISFPWSTSCNYVYFPEKSLDSLQVFPRDLCCILMPYLPIWFINLSKYGMLYVSYQIVTTFIKSREHASFIILVLSMLIKGDVFTSN